MDPAKVEAIREQWRQRALLLSRDQNTSARPPKDARYDSDRNRVVEREQRAARTDTLPDPNRGGGGKTRAQAQKKSPSRAGEKPVDLSRLGVLTNVAKNAGARNPQMEEREESAAPGPLGSGADQAILDEQLPVGAQNLLNTRESIYYTFYARIYETIGPIWRSKVRSQMMQRQVAPGKYSTVVEVILDENGDYESTRFVQTSGIPEFDRLVIEAWEAVPRFPNPPKDLIGRNGLVRMGWSFVVDVDQGAMWNFRNPARAY